MPAGHLIPPGSPQDWAVQQAQMRNASDELKLRQGIAPMQPGYAAVSVSQAGISGTFVDLTNLTKTVIVGTQRLIKVTGFVICQKHTTKASLSLWATDSVSGVINKYSQSVDGTTDDFATLVVIGIQSAPAAGTRTYKLQIDVPSGTADANVGGAGKPSYILVEDIGQAPA